MKRPAWQWLPIPRPAPRCWGIWFRRTICGLRLLPALAENPSVSEEALDGLAVSGSRSVVEVLLKSPRVMNSPRLLQALQANPNLRPNEVAEIAKKLAALEASPAAETGEAEPGTPTSHRKAVTKYLEENAAELAAEKDKPFQPIGVTHEELATCRARRLQVEPQAAAATASAEPTRQRSRSARPPRPRLPFMPRSMPHPGHEEGATARCRRLPSSTSRDGLRWPCAATRRTGRF